MVEGAQLLAAETDYPTARRLRDAAHAELQRITYEAQNVHGTDSPAAEGLVRDLQGARLDFQLLNRVCLRHAARRLDAVRRAGGKASELESAVILWDIAHPLGGT